MKRLAILAITLSCLAGLLCLAPGPETARASSSTTWTDANGDWNTAGNWTNGVPTGSTDAIITNGTSTVTLGSGATGNTDNLALASGNTLSLSLNSQFFISGTSISNAGQITINGGAGTNTFLVLDNNVTLSGAGTLTMTTASGGGNAFIEQAAAGLTLNLTNMNNNIQGGGIIGNNGLTVVNGAAGTIQANVNGQSLTLNGGGSLTNNGTMSGLGGGILNVNGSTPLTNYNAVNKTLTGGTYIVDGSGGSVTTMGLPLGTTGGEIFNNAANIILSGANANVAFVDTAGLDTLNNGSGGGLENNTAVASLSILNGYNLTTPGDFSNAGMVKVGLTAGDTSILKIGPAGLNTYTQSSGLTQGTGTIIGHIVINGGTIKPGDPPGTLSVFDLTLNNGTFLEQIAGSGSGQYGVLDVTGGNTHLGSGALLDISLLGGYDPVGHLFTILNDSGGSVYGTFANAPSGGFVMDQINWTIAYNSNDIVLDAVSPAVIPIPGSIWLTLSGLAGLWGMRRFRA